jgi:hypothetical protein
VKKVIAPVSSRQKLSEREGGQGTPQNYEAEKKNLQ